MNLQTDAQLEGQIPALIVDLGDEDILARQRARLLLAHLGQKSVPALLEALVSENVHTRWEAVRTLGMIRDPETAPALATMLMDDDTGVRWSAMESLINLGRAALPALLEKFAKDFDSIWLRRGTHHILHVLKDRQELTEVEILFFEALDKENRSGFESGWTSEQAFAAEKALEALLSES
ncbi:MAG: HEAT repeat domain-containing protein [Anaerolineales bacterium]|nr:HEAT repeat domain-containing protein [Anaerolineales bacterium]